MNFIVMTFSCYLLIFIDFHVNKKFIAGASQLNTAINLWILTGISGRSHKIPLFPRYNSRRRSTALFRRTPGRYRKVHSYYGSEMSRQYNFAALLLWNVLFPVVSFYPPVPYVFPALFYNSIILMARPLGIVFLMKTLFSHWLQCLSHASHILRKRRSERYLLLGKGMNKAHPMSVERRACDILRCGAARYFISGVQHAAFGYSFIT